MITAVDGGGMLASAALSPIQHLQDLYADRDRMLDEIAELRRFKALALGMITALSEERPEGAVKIQ